MGALGLIAAAVGWRLASSPSPYDRHLRLGSELERNGASRAAVRQYQLAAALDPAGVEAHERLATLYQRDGALALAIREWKTVAGHRPARAHGLCRLAAALAAGDLRAQALLVAQRAVREEPRCPRGHQVLGELHLARQDFQPARTELEAAVHLSPRDGALHLSLARLYFGLALPDLAEREARAAYQSSPRPAGSAAFLGHVLLNSADSGARAAAVPLLKEAIAATPQDVDAHVDLGRAYAQSGDPTAARGELEKALQLFPRSRVAVQQLAQVAETLHNSRYAQSLRRLGSSLAADDLRRKELERLMVRRPDDSALAYELGDLLARDGEYARATSLLEQAAQAQPGNAEINKRLEAVRRADAEHAPVSLSGSAP